MNANDSVQQAKKKRTTELVVRMKDDLSNVKATPLGPREHALYRKARVESLESMIETLEKQLEEME